MKLSKFLLDIFFPKFCFFCQNEGEYLCQDCKATIDILVFHKKEKRKYLNDIYYATNYKDFQVNFLIKKFKYPPFVKELAKDLAGLIFDHFLLLPQKLDFTGFVVVPVPLEKERENWRGFNQSKEIAKEISSFFHLELKDILLRKKKTLPQTNLSKKERRENLKDAFFLKEKMQNEKILLVDDVFTSGSTMEEAAKTLKIGGAKKVIGIAVAREF